MVEAELVTDYFSVDLQPDGRADQANADSPNLVVGSLPNGTLGRIVLVFALPEGVTEKTLRKAELELQFLNSFLRKKIPARLKHSARFGMRNPNPAGGHDVSFTDTGIVMADGGTKPNKVVSANVTKFVKEDLKGDPPGQVLVAFRIALEHELLPAGQRLLFAASEHPEKAAPKLKLQVRD